uniref:Uncharacterized protein n=1 Tax=Elaeophora elaphi TaxID=1147741 RepID=A0A0R3RPN2_9BILA
MHILLVPHIIEMFTAGAITLTLTLIPIFICREITDEALEKAYMSSEECALEMHKHLNLVKNDTVVEILQQSDDRTVERNISWLNIRRELYYQKTSVNSICVELGFRERFGATNSQFGSAYLIIPIVAGILVVLILLVQIIEFIKSNEESLVEIQILCGLICWLIVSIPLTLIDFNWNGTNEMVRNLGEPFPLEWKICKFAAWFWSCVKTIQFLLINCCRNVNSTKKIFT